MTSSASVPFAAHLVHVDGSGVEESPVAGSRADGRPVDGSTVVVLVGELDMDSAPVLGAMLDDVITAGPPEVVLEMSGLGFLDSTGLGVLIRAHKRMSAGGRRLVLRSPGPEPLKVLEITGLMAYLNVEPAASGENARGPAG